ncbi:hypothetical protein BHE90_004586 [Fusarium euwallaceae]|uniref:Uncharacterized protein n=1 Tax=Fusarium euwallaceae TaxID=1147111 RepID=A0A430LYT2_9HYPO|nr:hypothetical protein BHE90_004586 [Fusarium euwallaceae]
MSDRNHVDDPDFVIAKGKRPGVDDYVNSYTYSPSDMVYLIISGRREIPYKVEGANDGKHTLCNASGVTVKNGQGWSLFSTTTVSNRAGPIRTPPSRFKASLILAAFVALLRQEITTETR